jgi:cation diffusion facilitator CzcD-associated flavoprotein CzcO
MRIAVIGAGMSGIAAANVLNRSGHETVVFEKSADIGGVWAVAYPGIRLQNIASQYYLSGFPWPFVPDLHPTGAQIRKYLHEAMNHHQINVRLGHEVVGLTEQAGGWLVSYKTESVSGEEPFEYVVVAVGQYTEWKSRPEFEGEALFSGDIITERDVTDLEIFAGKRVVVV